MDVSAGIVFVAGTAAVAMAWVAIEKARSRAWSYRVLQVLAVLSVVLLGIVLFSDWPGEWLSTFWADHSVLAGLLSTVLLVGAGLLGIEARDVSEQARLAEAMGGTALGGLVGPLLSVDLALGLLAVPSDTWPPGWSGPGDPLRWVRALTESEHKRLRSPGVGVATLEAAGGDAVVLLDRCIRRTVAAARDWAALAAGSGDGRAVLASFGAVRNQLVRLQELIRIGDPRVLAAWKELRADVQQLLVALELASGSPAPRTLIRDLPTSDIDVDRAAVISKYLGQIGVSSKQVGAIRHLLPSLHDYRM